MKQSKSTYTPGGLFPILGLFSFVELFEFEFVFVSVSTCMFLSTVIVGIGNGYGFEYLITALDRLNRTIQLGSHVRDKSFLDYIDTVMGNNGYANLGRNKAYNFWRGGQ